MVLKTYLVKDEVAKQMQDTLNWAVLGTGVIANEMAQALQKMGKSLICSWKPDT